MLTDDQWEWSASTGIISDNMAIDSEFLESLEIDNMMYRLKVIALREGSSLDNIGNSVGF